MSDASKMKGHSSLTGLSTHERNVLNLKCGGGELCQIVAAAMCGHFAVSIYLYCKITHNQLKNITFA